MEQFQLQCLEHKLPICAALLQSESYLEISKQSLLKCIDCIVEQQINGKDLITFSMKKNPSNMSVNSFGSAQLNPTQKAQIQKFQTSQSSANIAQIRQQIQEFFQTFLKEVSEKKLSLEKEVIMRLDQNEQLLKQLQDRELLKSLKQNLLQAVSRGNKDRTKLNEEVTSLIEAYQKASVERLKRIDQDLADCQTKMFQFNEEQSNTEKDNILKQFQIEKFLEFEGSGSLKFELIKTKIENSNQSLITRYKDDGVMIKTPSEGRILEYSNFLIDPKLKYLITIEVHNQAKNGYQLIGLMEDEAKEIKLLRDLGLAFSNYIAPYGLTKKIKGENFTKTLKKVQHFELQIHICLQDKQFIVSDFPEKNNIFALEETAIQDKNYRLGVELYYVNDSITIKMIQIVQQFPKLL